MLRRFGLAVVLCLMSFAVVGCFSLVSPPAGIATRATVCIWGDSVFFDAQKSFTNVLAPDGIAFVDKSVPGDGLSELDSFYLPAIADVNKSVHCDMNIAELGNNDLNPTDPVEVAGVTPYAQRFLAALDPNMPFVWVTPSLTGPLGWDQTILHHFDDVVAETVSAWSPTATTITADQVGYETVSDRLHPSETGCDQIAQFVDQRVNAMTATTTTTAPPDTTTTAPPDTTTTVPDTTTTTVDPGATTTTAPPDTTTTTG